MTLCTVCHGDITETEPGYVTLADGTAMHVACYDALPQYQVRHVPHGVPTTIEPGEAVEPLAGHHGRYGALAVKR